MLFTAGVLTATGVLGLPYWVITVSIIAAACAGYQLGYLIGRRIGPRLFTRPDSRFFFQDNARRARDFVERYGARAIVLARFVPIVRTFAPVVARVGAMQARLFLVCNVLGGVAWVVGLVTLGYFLGGVPFVAAHVEVCVLGVVAVSMLPAAVARLQPCGSRITNLVAGAPVSTLTSPPAVRAIRRAIARPRPEPGPGADVVPGAKMARPDRVRDRGRRRPPRPRPARVSGSDW